MTKIQTTGKRVALVTGAARGIGRAIALQLARAGMDIAVHYGSSEREASETVNAVEQFAVGARAIHADMGDPGSIKALFAELDKTFGRLDILVNNAAILQPGALESLREQDLMRTFAINVQGPAVAAREAAARMINGGHIINISSSRAHFAAAGTGSYSASKAALEWMTRVWAQELGGRGIRVNAVAPGPTAPGMFERAPEFLQAAAVKSSPFGRIGDASEIADLVCFLCSDNASWISGQVILANGAGCL
ncbi:SDR family oxidoreductase [Microbulbifer sp. SAOS-129_SWC]|uniref:SDR family NAD(P)-dependent oxidoreductase n=1 Tax=Microbulbifer sp. SAOS-129_SWC TaxID=3145235 RepID=UPI003216EE58